MVTNAQYFKKSNLLISFTAGFKLNLGDILATEIDITKYIVNAGDISEKLSKSSIKTGGVILPKLHLTLDNSRGKWDKESSFFKNGFINNSVFSLTVCYENYEEDTGYEAITPVYKFTGLIKYISCEWDRTKYTFEVDIIHASNLLATEKVFPGILANDTFKNICYDILYRQPFKKYMTIDPANFTFGWDVEMTDSIAGMVNKKVKDVLDEIMLLTGSIYYVDYDQKFIIEPIIPATPTAICIYRGDDIFKINSEKYDWNGHYTGIKWDDNTNPIQRAEMKFISRELYQYDYSELVLSSKYITDPDKREIILNNLLGMFEYVKRELTITCKWNPEVIVNKYISLDVPKEIIIDDNNMVWNKDTWNSGKHWNIGSPGISFDPNVLWRVLDIKRDSFGTKMQLTLLQLIADDGVDIISGTNSNSLENSDPEGGGTETQSDHGNLTGLLDDDHPQYHNNARGDVRYLAIANAVLLPTTTQKAALAGTGTPSASDKYVNDSDPRNTNQRTPSDSSVSAAKIQSYAVTPEKIMGGTQLCNAVPGDDMTLLYDSYIIDGVGINNYTFTIDHAGVGNYGHRLYYIFVKSLGTTSTKMISEGIILIKLDGTAIANYDLSLHEFIILVCNGTNFRMIYSSVDSEHPLISVHHSVSGLTPGNFLKALTATTFGFAAHGLNAADVSAVAANGAIVAGTNTKITYDAKGLVTSATAATLASVDFANQGTTATVLHGNAAGNPSFGAVIEADITLANNTTNNVSVAAHGFAPIAPADATKVLGGLAGIWVSVPCSSTAALKTTSVALGSAGTVGAAADIGHTHQGHGQLASISTAVTVTTTNAETTLLTVNLPANLLTTTALANIPANIRCLLRGDMSCKSTSGTFTFRWYLGNTVCVQTVVLASQTNAATFAFEIDTNFKVLSAIAYNCSHFGKFYFSTPIDIAVSPAANTAYDSASVQALTITVQMATADASNYVTAKQLYFSLI